MSPKSSLPLAQPTLGLWETLELLEDQHWVASSLQGSGELEFSGVLRFSGKWDGVVKGGPGSHLIVLAGGSVTGRIDVDKLSVEGKLVDIVVKARSVHVLNGAELRGQLSSEKFAIDEGALIDGRMGPL